MEESKEIQVTILKTETVQSIKDYLETRPYVEVAHLVAAIVMESQTIKPEMLQPEKEEQDA